jgi:hypothetical protein
MLIDVQDATLNLILNACFYGIGLVALASLLSIRTRRWMPWAPPLLAVGFYTAYEVAMPPFWDIRLDLLLILPLLAVTFTASGFRLYLLRKEARPTP